MRTSNFLALAVLGIAVCAAGCQTPPGDDPAYYNDKHGVHTSYTNYPIQPYHEESFYYRGSPYLNPLEHHHSGYGSGY